MENVPEPGQIPRRTTCQRPGTCGGEREERRSLAGSSPRSVRPCVESASRDGRPGSGEGEATPTPTGRLPPEGRSTMPPRAQDRGCLEREGGPTPPGRPPLAGRIGAPCWCWCRFSSFLGLGRRPGSTEGITTARSGLGAARRLRRRPPRQGLRHRAAHLRSEARA